jgi:hypothetical protein
MPFEKIDPIAEALELQEMFKDEPKTLFQKSRV